MWFQGTPGSSCGPAEAAMRFFYLIVTVLLLVSLWLLEAGARRTLTILN